MMQATAAVWSVERLLLLMRPCVRDGTEIYYQRTEFAFLIAEGAR